jgi:hypothetical protein
MRRHLNALHLWHICLVLSPFGIIYSLSALSATETAPHTVLHKLIAQKDLKATSGAGYACNTQVCNITKKCVKNIATGLFESWVPHPHYQCHIYWLGSCSNFGTAPCETITTYFLPPCTPAVQFSTKTTTAQICGL